MHRVPAIGEACLMIPVFELADRGFYDCVYPDSFVEVSWTRSNEVDFSYLAKCYKESANAVFHEVIMARGLMINTMSGFWQPHSPCVRLSN